MDPAVPDTLTTHLWALSFVGAATQLILALACLMALVIARRAERLPSGQYWIAAQASLAAAMIAILVRAFTSGPDADYRLPGDYRVLAGLYIGGKAAFFLALALGTEEMMGRAPTVSMRHGAVVLASLLAVVSAAWASDVVTSGRVQGGLAVVLMGASAWRLWRAPAAVRTNGSHFLAVALALYGVMALPYLFGWRFAIMPVPGAIGRAMLLALDRSSLLDIVAQCLLAIALMVLLFDRQRTASVNKTSEFDALRREADSAARLEELGRVAATVAHELNNPLAVVLGTAEQLLANNPAAEMRDDVERILREAVRCQTVARDLLLYARDQQPSLAPVAIGPLVAEAMEAVRMHAAAAGVRLDNAVRTTAVLDADRTGLQRAFVNLLTNALDASPAGAVVRAESWDAGEALWIAFEDRGAGIRPEVRDRIFEPFFSTKAAGQGTGLGLAITRGIVERHGGTMSVESMPERPVGTRVIIRLPLSLTSQDAPAVTPGEATPSALRLTPSSSSTVARSRFGTPARSAPAVSPVRDATPPHTSPASRRVLVVDDEAGIRNVLTRLIERHGFVVEPAANGLLAQAILRRDGASAFAALFCDVRMPGLDGPSLVAWIQAEMPALLPRTVILSGDTVSPEIAALTKRSGCLLLAKPFRQQDIAALLAQLAPSPAPGSTG